MFLRSFDELYSKVKGMPKKCVAVAAAHHENVLDAVLHAAGENVIDYLLIGDCGKVKEIGAGMGYDIDSSLIVASPDDTESAKAAVSLVREGKADFIMKGKLDTGVLMRAVLDSERGLRTSRAISTTAIHQVPAYHKLLTIADGGMIPYPTLEQKMDIIRNAVELHWKLGYKTPKVAILAANEKVSEKMPETVDALKIKEAAEKGEFGDCIVDGSLSLDLAISRESAEIKGIISPVNADVDILITPNIASGNIFSKSLYLLAGAKMAGCMTGARVPIVLTSRGASAEEKLYSIILSAAVVD